VDLAVTSYLGHFLIDRSHDGSMISPVRSVIRTDLVRQVVDVKKFACSASLGVRLLTEKGLTCCRNTNSNGN